MNTSDAELSTYQWVLAGFLVFLLLIFVSRTDTGYRIIYYGLVLMLLFLFVTQWQFIAQALAPIGTPAPDSGKQ